MCSLNFIRITCRFLATRENNFQDDNIAWGLFFTDGALAGREQEQEQEQEQEPSFFARNTISNVVTIRELTAGFTPKQLRLLFYCH